MSQLRLQINRRRDLIGKKEMNIMEWAKRNQQERANNERDKKELDLERQSLLNREAEFNDKMKKLKRREYDEIGKKSKILEGKKELL